MLDILKIIYEFENHAATTLEIRAVRKKLGFSDEKSYNSLIAQNGKRVKSYFDKEPILDEDGVETFWNWFFEGEYVDGLNSINTKANINKSAIEHRGLTIPNEDINKLIPVKFSDEYPVIVDGIEADARLNINGRLFYRNDNLKEHIEKLYSQNQKEIPIKIEFEDKNRKGFEFKLKKELIEAIKSKYPDLEIKYPHNSYDLIDTLLGDEKPSVSLDDFKPVESTKTTDYYSSFYEYLLENDYYFDKETIENYLLSLKVKPFAILTGNSGTGKTKLSQLFAKYLAEDGIKKAETVGERVIETEPVSETTEIKVKDGYLDIEVKLSTILKSNECAIPKPQLDKYVRFDLYQGRYSALVDGIESNFAVILVPYLTFGKKVVSQYFEPLNTGDKDQKVNLKVKLDDIKDYLSVPEREDSLDINWKIGKFPENKQRALSNVDACKLLSRDSYNVPCEVIVNDSSIEAKFHLFTMLNHLSNSKDSIDYIDNELYNKDRNEKFNITLDLNSFEPTLDNFEDIIEESKEEYLEAEIPIGSTQVKNSVFEEVLPLDLYSGNCDYVIDGFPVKGNISLYVKLKLKDKTTTGDIKIKYDDILDLITDEGYLADNFNTKVKVGSSYYRHTWDLSEDNNIEELIPIKTYSKECEIIVDDVPQKNNISIYPVIRFDNDEELSNHLKRLYDEDPSQLIDLNIDLTNFERDVEDSDYVIPLKSSSSDILVETLDDVVDEYISFEMSRGTSLEKCLNKGEFGAPTRKWGPIKDIINLNKLSKELVKFKIDDIEVDASLLINSYIWCGDESLSDYFRESSNKDTFSIKVKKEDIKNLISPPIDMSMQTMEFKRKLGTKEIWACPLDFINDFIPLKNKSYLNVFIDGKPTVVEFIIFKIEVILKEGIKGFTYFKEKSSKNPDDEIIITAYLNPNSLENMFDEEYLDSMESYEVLDSMESYEVLNSVDSKSFNILSNYKIVPVGANWTENRNIVGYYNLITEEYQSTPAYDLINQSKDNLDSPHFLILDEMNLSHVERYFADFLSAIESGESIPLYGIEDDLEIPENLFIIGTVNVDETTYMFSPKVLDRANVLEFKTYSSKDYMLGNINLNSPNGNIGYLENPLSDLNIKNLGINELKEAFKGVKVNGNEFWNILANEIFEFQKILKKSGFDFGFRVINEIARFMLVAWKYEGEPTEWNNWERYFDAQIKQKMLPKLHGSEKILGDTLTDLSKLCESEEGTKYYTSAKKLNEMIKVLDKQRYVSFIN